MHGHWLANDNENEFAHETRTHGSIYHFFCCCFDEIVEFFLNIVKEFHFHNFFSGFFLLFECPQEMHISVSVMFLCLTECHLWFTSVSNNIYLPWHLTYAQLNIFTIHSHIYWQEILAPLTGILELKNHSPIACFVGMFFFSLFTSMQFS